MLSENYRYLVILFWKPFKAIMNNPNEDDSKVIAQKCAYPI